jgi:hypothetical protein
MTYSIQTRSQSKNTHSCAKKSVPKKTYDLRSFTPKEIQPSFNFDESNRAWLSNKRSVGNGCYTYLVDETVDLQQQQTERPKRMRRSPVRYQI